MIIVKWVIQNEARRDKSTSICLEIEISGDNENYSFTFSTPSDLSVSSFTVHNSHP
jgi:hypothetical protein